MCSKSWDNIKVRIILAVIFTAKVVVRELLMPVQSAAMPCAMR